MTVCVLHCSGRIENGCNRTPFRGAERKDETNDERRSKPMKKLIALILSLCMLVGMLPAMAERPPKRRLNRPMLKRSI